MIDILCNSNHQVVKMTHLPDEIVRIIQEFSRPILKTTFQWVDFYLAKTKPLVYRVGMKFIIEGVIRTLVSITAKNFITTDGTKRKYHPINSESFFKYKGFEIHEEFHWYRQYTTETSYIKRKYISNILEYKQALFHFNSSPITNFRNKWYSRKYQARFQFKEDYTNYAEWGSVITGV